MVQKSVPKLCSVLFIMAVTLLCKYDAEEWESEIALEVRKPGEAHPVASGNSDLSPDNVFRPLASKLAVRMSIQLVG